MRILIIGASGFLGGHVCQRVAAAGHSVVTAGRSALPGSAAHQIVDLATDQPGKVAAMLSALGPDVVVNCAGLTAGDQDMLAAVNITGTYALVAAMLSSGLPARLVHIGSAAEYGSGKPGDAVAESTPARPETSYGSTKLAGTRLVELARSAGLEAVVLRVFNPLGPGAPEDSLPGRVAAQLRRLPAGDDSLRLGSLDGVRDFVDVRDVADGVLAATVAPALPHPVLNIGSGRPVLVRSMVRDLLAVSGCSCPVAEDGQASSRSASWSWQQADIGRATRDLDWLPRRDLGTSLADMWEASHDLDIP